MKGKYKYNNRAKRIRLVYVSIARYFQYTDDIIPTGIGETYLASSVFEIPSGLDIEKTCKIISYLSDKVEKGANIEPCSSDSVCAVSHELKNYGFKKVEGYGPHNYHAHGQYVPFSKITIDSEHIEIPECIDLFTVDGDSRLFRRSNLACRYFNWYSKRILSCL